MLEKTPQISSFQNTESSPSGSNTCLWTMSGAKSLKWPFCSVLMLSFELQQAVLNMATCLKALSCWRAIGWFHICISLAGGQVQCSSFPARTLQCFLVSLGFLDDFLRIYGSFIPLRRSDVMRHLMGKFNSDLSDRWDLNGPDTCLFGRRFLWWIFLWDE